jgi:hypothetical protein
MRSSFNARTDGTYSNDFALRGCQAKTRAQVILADDFSFLNSLFMNLISSNLTSERFPVDKASTNILRTKLT